MLMRSVTYGLRRIITVSFVCARSAMNEPQVEHQASSVVDNHAKCEMRERFAYLK
jgi:hypothetical protein